MIGTESSSTLEEAAGERERAGCGELLRRYCAQGDDSAFAELVRRHAGMVLGVCRRLLRNEQDAEDAFQATFLVLAQNARRVRRPDAVASWLYGVARRVALRRGQQRRICIELPLIDDSVEATRGEPSVLDAIAQRGEQQMLDEELESLPDKYRQPLILHFLMGKTSAEVASQLGVSVSAVEGRLKRGKRELRMRLLRRGVNAGAVLLAICSLRSSAHAAATKFIDKMSGAGQSLDGDSGAGAFNDDVERLVRQEVFHTMQKTTFTGRCFTAALTLFGVGMLTYGLSAPAPGQQDGTAQTLDVDVDHDAEPAPIAVAQADRPPAFDPFGGATPGKTPARKKPKSKPQAATTAQASPYDYKPLALAEQKIYAALKETAMMEFIETPLSDVVDYLSQTHDVRFWIDRRALDDVGVAVDAPITLSIEDVTVQSALSLLLSPLDLDYVVEDEVLKITSVEEAESKLDTRVYQVRGLSDYDPEQLAEVIETTIAPDSWEAAGGAGVVRALPDLLIVTQSQNVHRKIVDLLVQLERHLEASSD